jgi:pyridoxal/pyridoxine/pyridoxamine kinase
LFQIEVAGVKVVVEAAWIEGHVAVPVTGHLEAGVMTGDLVEGQEMTEALEVVVTVIVQVTEVVHEEAVIVVQGEEVQTETGVGDLVAGEIRARTVEAGSQTALNHRMQTSSHWATPHLATGVG